jgi:small subunit ribosomal protein S17
MNNAKTSKIKVLDGTVTSIGMQKTVTVLVEHSFRHPLYRKAVKRHQKFAVHNEIAGIAVGDKVQIHETKPLSKRIHFVVVSKAR